MSTIIDNNQIEQPFKYDGGDPILDSYSETKSNDNESNILSDNESISPIMMDKSVDSLDKLESLNKSTESLDKLELKPTLERQTSYAEQKTIIDEPLQQDEKRLTVLPVHHPDVWSMYQKHKALFWIESEVDLTKDMEHWNKLTNDEKHFIKYVLGFFASSDVIVSENLAKRFQNDVKMLEAKAFYGFQNMMEFIHSEMYSLLIMQYITDPDEQTRILNSVETIPCIGKKAAWAQKWIESSDSFATRLIAFVIVEGVFFSGSFCSIYWLAERGILPGLTLSNHFISRDEGLHCDFGCLLYNNYVKNKLSQERFEEIMCEAVELEIVFITDALPCRLIGINNTKMIQYIKYVADRIAKQLGHKPIYNEQQPFAFMDRIALTNKSNFFERTPSEYSLGNHDGDEDPYGSL